MVVELSLGLVFGWVVVGVEGVRGSRGIIRSR